MKATLVYVALFLLVLTNSFSKCATCTILEKHRENAVDYETKARYGQLKDEHHERQHMERRYYYSKRDASRKAPLKSMSIIIDGMDQAKTNLPHFTGRISKDVNPSDLLKTRVTGVINHGVGGFHTYVDINEYAHDPNLTINVLLKALKKAADRNGNTLPAILYVQADNCGRENKNRYVLAFLELLVAENIFHEVHLSFLYVGHTHEDIDAAFSKISQTIKGCDIETLPELINVLPEPEEIGQVYNVKEWMEPYLAEMSKISFPLHYKFEKENNIVKMYYKGPHYLSWVSVEEKILSGKPQGKPKQVKPDYSKINIDKNIKQIRRLQPLFKNPHSVQFWEEFYSSIKLSTRNVKETKWLLDELPRQRDESIEMENLEVPDRIKKIIDKETTVPKVIVKRKKKQVKTKVSEKTKESNDAKKTGQKKYKEIKECSSSPCMNAGSCVDHVNGFECNCASGFTGEKCETDLDECLSAPCVNGGSCDDKINGYLCRCAAGYFGVNCQTDVNDCQSNPCLNGGSCKDNVNGRECHCSAGFDGKDCETNIEKCSLNPCRNGGSYDNSYKKYTRTCVAGYIGNVCETDIDECSPNPCQNGGKCKDDINRYICVCAAGYEGNNCETDIDECVPNRCQNDGSCVDGLSQYTCTCAEGYNGKDCKTDIDECSTNPCQNGGSCIDGINEYICSCVRGFRGLDCEISSTTSSRISLVFPATVNNTLRSDSGIQQNVRAELITYFRGKLGQSFRDIIMLQLRHGNLIVDFVINYEHDSTAAIKLATAVTELVSGEATLEFMNEIVCATAITINNITVTAETLKTSGTLCKVYIALNGECANNMKCVVEDGSPTCVSTTSKFSLTHLIVVIVCPLVSLILVSAAVCICVRTYRVRKRKNDNDKNYDAGYDDIHGRPDMSRNCYRSPQPCSHLQPEKKH